MNFGVIQTERVLGRVFCVDGGWATRGPSWDTSGCLRPRRAQNGGLRAGRPRTAYCTCTCCTEPTHGSRVLHGAKNPWVGSVHGDKVHAPIQTWRNERPAAVAQPHGRRPRSPRARVAEVADGDEGSTGGPTRASGPRPPGRGTDVKPCPRRPAPATPARRRLRAAATPPPDVRTTILVAAVVRARARPLAPSTLPRRRRRRPSRALTSGLSQATGRYGVPLARAGRGGAGVAKLGRKSGFEGQFWHFFVPSDAASSSWGALN